MNPKNCFLKTETIAVSFKKFFFKSYITLSAYRSGSPGLKTAAFSGACGRGSQEEETPNAAVAHFLFGDENGNELDVEGDEPKFDHYLSNRKQSRTHHHDPRNKVKFFDDVKQVKCQEDSGYPESAHGAKVEPVGPRVVIHFRHHNADEAQNVQNLSETSGRLD